MYNKQKYYYFINNMKKNFVDVLYIPSLILIRYHAPLGCLDIMILRQPYQYRFLKKNFNFDAALVFKYETFTLNWCNSWIKLVRSLLKLQAKEL